jgi:hypothetical protein
LGPVAHADASSTTNAIEAPMASTRIRRFALAPLATVGT